jgi:hypothetical protein
VDVHRRSQVNHRKTSQSGSGVKRHRDHDTPVKITLCGCRTSPAVVGSPEVPEDHTCWSIRSNEINLEIGEGSYKGREGHDEDVQYSASRHHPSRFST